MSEALDVASATHSRVWSAQHSIEIQPGHGTWFLYMLRRVFEDTPEASHEEVAHADE